MSKINAMRHGRTLRHAVAAIALETVLFFSVFTAVATASAFTKLQGASLYTDLKARQVGDVLTVLIVESAAAQNTVTINTDKKSEFDLDAGPGFGSLNFIPIFGGKGTSVNTSENEGTNERSGDLRAKMAVQVVGIRDNGDLVIEGSRVVGINSDKEMMTLTGVVRAEDITPENTIPSYQIADAQITYRGKGIATNGGRPGWIMRFLNWVF